MMSRRVLSRMIRGNICLPATTANTCHLGLSSAINVQDACAYNPKIIQAPQLLRPLYSVRQFSSSKRKKSKVDPFRVLKVKRQTPYSHVKKLFLKVAMQHHPDTQSGKTKEEQDKSRDIFIKVRQAFEELAEDPETGGICLREELEGYVADEEHAHMDEWFKQETGYDMPFMDEETMKEVAAMTEAVGGGGQDRGLDRDGGMWELARMVTRTVKSGGDGKNLLKLEAGDIKETAINDTRLRARRRRN